MRSTPRSATPDVDEDAPPVEEEDLPSALDALSAYFADVGNGRAR